MFKTILLATTSAGKFREIKEFFSKDSYIFQSLAKSGIQPPLEDKFTFLENALLKARNGAKHSGLPTIADDSGIMVPYLKGSPGIHSKRFAVENNRPATPEENRSLLLELLEHTKGEQRRASFYTIIVYMESADDPAPCFGAGRIWGHIATESRGDSGFGYDSIFIPDKHRKTMAEMTPEEKQKISHRSRALKNLLASMMRTELAVAVK